MEVNDNEACLDKCWHPHFHREQARSYKSECRLRTNLSLWE